MSALPMDSSRLDEPRDTKSDHRLVLLSLPKEWQDYDLKKDDFHRLSDVEKFCRVLESRQEPLSDDGDKRDSGGGFDTIIDTGGMQPKDLIVAFDLEFGWTAGKNSETVRIRLNRDANEISQRAFQRMELSVAKKLSPGKKKKEKKKKDGKNGGTNQPGGEKEEISVRPSSRLLVGGNIDTTTGDGIALAAAGEDTRSICDEIDTEQFDAIGLCRELANFSESSMSVGLEMSMPLQHEEGNGESEKSSCRNFRFEVDSNPPVILATKTFENFRSKLFVGIPVVVQTILLHATKVEVSWFVSSNGEGGKVEDEEAELLPVLRNSHAFVPEARHIGKSIVVVIRPVRGEGKTRRYGRPEAYRFANAVEELPAMPIVSPLRDDFRQRDNPQDRVTDNSPGTSRLTSLRVCTYNILADLYVSRKGTTDGSTTYPHVKYEHVQKARRIPMIVAELLAYKADIICLQEVDGSVFDAYLNPVLRVLGYEGYYSNKATLSREGCAMFWSTRVFEAKQALSFRLKDLLSAPCDNTSSEFEREWWKSSIKGIHELLKSHPKLDQVVTEKCGHVLQIARLIPKQTKSGQPNAVVVANTHLFYHPMGDHVRAMQTCAVAKKIDEVCRQQQDGESSRAPPDPFVLCGDLNSDPLSGACQLLTTRILKPNHHDCWMYLNDYRWDVDDNDVDEVVESGTTAEERRAAARSRADYDKSAATGVKPPSLEMPDSFPNLVSACQPTPAFSMFSLKYAQTLDYVLASKPSKQHEFGFLPHRSAPMPCVEDVKEWIEMPNEVMPSDHVAIVCDLKWSQWNDHSAPE